NQNPYPDSKPNTARLPITLGESHGSGHFYLAKNRTFLLCVDTTKLRRESSAKLVASFPCAFFAELISEKYFREINFRDF
ncbi:MAG: hypothetical protein WA766_06980, partial [Candidatus Acidiferrales bacterium]